MSNIEISDVNVSGFDAAIRGMRNSRKSREKSDSWIIEDGGIHELGPKDLKLAGNLARIGGSEAKFRRMIHVSMDIKAPLYWWKQFDTYKIGTTANSESTMFTITDKEFEIGDFALDVLNSAQAGMHLMKTIDVLNELRTLYLKEDNNAAVKWMYWKDIIRTLPESYLQLRTVDLNYEVLARIYKERLHHKLNEWGIFCKCIVNELPYSEELIICSGGDK